VAYTIFPWAGVMAAGYVAGQLFALTVAGRIYFLRFAGVLMLVVFVTLRLINDYGEPAPWSAQKRGTWYTFLSFLNVSKYPPSLMFLLLTLGVACLLLALFENAEKIGFKSGMAKVVGVLKVYGGVPFFFYLLHIPLIVLGAHIWAYVRFGQFVNLAFMPAEQLPATYEPGLLRTYIVWILYCVLLYFPCRWYARYKASHRHWWLSYL
jgi:uncharacterized membrane protein